MCVFLLQLFVVTIVYSAPAPIFKEFDIWGDSKTRTIFDNSSNNHVFNDSYVNRLPKVLNFFPVPFEEECLSNDQRRKGACLNAYECRIQGGSSHGKCALGFGVCCVFTATCDTEVQNNITYFVNPDFPDFSTRMSTCKTIIQKVDPDIAQLKLDFIHFNLGQPNRQTGVCDDDIFMISGGVTGSFNLCGLNSGQHVYLDVIDSNETISLSMNFGAKTLFRIWEVRIEQIPFTQRAPTGCLQYHILPQGIIQTMNFAENGRHLANQDYKICVRQEKNMCSIVYEPCHENSFRIGPGNQTTPLPGTENGEEQDTGSGDGDARGMCSDVITLPCDTDDILMPGDLSSGYCELSSCGNSLCSPEETTCRIESSVIPFTIGVQFGDAAREESPEDNLGMCLRYQQLPCIY